MGLFFKKKNKNSMKSVLYITIVIFQLSGSVDVAEPPDFEEFVVQNQSLVDRDPYRDRLLYPDDDDIDVLSLPKRCRTVTHIVPEIGYVMS